MKLFFAQLPGATRFFCTRSWTHNCTCGALQNATWQRGPAGQPPLQNATWHRHLALHEPVFRAQKGSRKPRFFARIPPESFLTLRAARVRSPHPLSKHEATASGRPLRIRAGGRGAFRILSGQRGPGQFRGLLLPPNPPAGPGQFRGLLLPPNPLCKSAISPCVSQFSELKRAPENLVFLHGFLPNRSSLCALPV